MLKEQFQAETGANSVWEYKDSHSFLVKPKLNLSLINQNRNEIQEILLPYEVTHENRDLRFCGIKVWNFYGDVLNGETEEVKIIHGQEDGSTVAVTVLGSIEITDQTPIFTVSPDPLNDHTELGIYIFGLPQGVKAVDAAVRDRVISFRLAGNSTVDMDYDSNIHIRYIYNLSLIHISEPTRP